MDFEVPLARGAFRGSIAVPASKSVWQRVLVLSALADQPPELTGADPETCGDDVRSLAAAVGALGRWQDGALGAERTSLQVDLGLGATGFRFLLPLAAMRPAGARTLVTGRPELLLRPHRPLVHALGTFGVRCKRRHSGSIRVHGGGYRGAVITLDGRTSSQFASALMLAAPRTGGITIRFPKPCVSRPYLHLTKEVLAAFGVACALEGLDRAGGVIRVEAGTPAADVVHLPPDASAAAAIFAAAALSGGSVAVPGLDESGDQADLALLPILERMGARTEPDGAGVRVTGPGSRLRAPGEVDLSDAPDLLPILGALAAGADGTTHITGVAHARGKESDRIETTAGAIRALGGSAETQPGGLVVHGAALSGGDVPVSGDHRIAFAFGPVGLVVPGVRLLGAQAVSKSHPRFLEDLARVARGS